jgi:carboxyl-terminal processing protease
MTKTTSEENETRNIYEHPSLDERKIALTTTIIVSFITMVIGLALGIVWTKNSQLLANNNGSVEKIDFDELNEVYTTLAQNFDGEIDKQKVIEEAKRGLVNAAGDTYTYYLTKSEAKDFKKDLSGDVGAGIGVEIGQRDGYVKVLRTTEDNPARRAGVLAGDIIYKADGEDISALSVEDVAKRLRGAAGSTVKLTVVRGGKELEFELVREIINNKSVYSEVRGKTAIITITRFDNDTGKLTRSAAQQALQLGIDKVIIDLRGNGGGYVSAAQEVASLWVDGKTIVTQRSANGEYNEDTKAYSGGNILGGIKTIVLTNGSTASASEIVAGALKDYGMATLIGEKTYGKGSVQTLENLSNGEMLRVTIAKWYTPNGKNINGEGIEPDVEVERTFEQINKEEDPQLDKALEY